MMVAIRKPLNSTRLGATSGPPRFWARAPSRRPRALGVFQHHKRREIYSQEHNSRVRHKTRLNFVPLNMIGTCPQYSKKKTRSRMSRSDLRYRTPRWSRTPSMRLKCRTCGASACFCPTKPIIAGRKKLPCTVMGAARRCQQHQRNRMYRRQVSDGEINPCGSAHVTGLPSLSCHLGLSQGHRVPCTTPRSVTLGSVSKR